MNLFYFRYKVFFDENEHFYHIYHLLTNDNLIKKNENHEHAKNYY